VYFRIPTASQELTVSAYQGRHRCPPTFHAPQTDAAFANSCITQPNDHRSLSQFVCSLRDDSWNLLLSTLEYLFVRLQGDFPRVNPCQSKAAPLAKCLFKKTLAVNKHPTPRIQSPYTLRVILYPGSFAADENGREGDMTKTLEVRDAIPNSGVDCRIIQMLPHRFK
jgi:hypothetical protein